MLFYFLFQVNNLTLLASLTLQKVLNIKNNNSSGGDTQIEKHQKQQLQQQQQLRQSLNISDNNVLNELLKNGAVFTKTVTTPTAPIAIERKRQPQQQLQHQLQQQHQKHQNSAQKQRLNSSISSTHSSTSTNSSYGSSSDDAAAVATATKVTTLATPSTTATATTKASSIKLPEKSKIPSDILDDLASRFIINVPDMELNNLIRICFQVEQAHWFYLDFFCAPAVSEDGESQNQSQTVQRKLPAVGIKQFAMQLFQVGS